MILCFPMQRWNWRRILYGDIIMVLYMLINMILTPVIGNTTSM